MTSGARRFLSLNRFLTRTTRTVRFAMKRMKTTWSTLRRVRRISNCHARRMDLSKKLTKFSGNSIKRRDGSITGSLIPY